MPLRRFRAPRVGLCDLQDLQICFVSAPRVSHSFGVIQEGRGRPSCVALRGESGEGEIEIPLSCASLVTFCAHRKLPSEGRRPSSKRPPQGRAALHPPSRRSGKAPCRGAQPCLPAAPAARRPPPPAGAASAAFGALGNAEQAALSGFSAFFCHFSKKVLCRKNNFLVMFFPKAVLSPAAHQAKNSTICGAGAGFTQHLVSNPEISDGEKTRTNVLERKSSIFLRKAPVFNDKILKIVLAF